VYSQTSLAQAVTDLAIRLYDPGHIYWTWEEKSLRVIQALRMWQAFTGYYRERVAFFTQPGDHFYDLAAILPPEKLGCTITDQHVIKQIQYSLLEPATGFNWTGTPQFSLEACSSALQRRRNQFLGDTGLVITPAILDPPSPPVSRVPLPESTLDVRRAAWIDYGFLNFRYPLFRSDEYAAQSYDAAFAQTPATPHSYSVAVSTPPSLELIPPPLDKGQVEAMLVLAGPALDPSHGTGVLTGIPDDFNWAVEFGALADLLSTDGLTRDPSRSKYCESIYTLGVGVARSNPSVLVVRVDDVPVFTCSLYDLDAFSTQWQNFPARPETSAMAGRNLLALAARPDSLYGISLDIVPNFPIPANETEFLQVGLDHLEAVLDLAQHLCAFKQGGQEFVDSIPLVRNFLRIAALQNSKLTANVFYRDALYQISLLQEMRFPAITKGTATTAKAVMQTNAAEPTPSATAPASTTPAQPTPA
jgi:hypothetical protein